ncbi:MAG: glycoside hydrolase family 25 protein [Roseburia sp.]|nr:glycoside hydrolase family 25 protein [Roseburia sp.]
MDSKGKRIGILLVLLAVMLVMAALVVVNFSRLKGRPRQPVQEQNTQDYTGRTIEADGRVRGADLSAFLRDEEFFDEVTDGGDGLLQAAYDEVDENGELVRTLTLLVSSVERDIRVKIVDDKGEVVSGQAFAVQVADTGAYIDEDRDGIIHISGIKPGQYQVSLSAIEGFAVPEEPANVRVKSIVSYTVIDDIEYFVHSESEVDILKEDAERGHGELDEEDEDDTQYTALLDMEGRDNAVALGIDVSKWNGEIDWDIVKAEGVDFAIIRCGYRGSSSGWLVEDPYFYKNIEGARSAGIKVGIYFFTQAVSQVEAVEEASMVISLLGDVEPDYPIFIDTEGAGGSGRADTLDVATRTAVVNAFCQTIQNAGLEAGVYASRNWYYNNLALDETYSHKIWLAEYRQTPEYTGRYDMWQYTSGGSVAGIEGRVDLNVSYLGY